MMGLVVRRVQEQEVLEIAVPVEHLNAPVAAVGDIDVSLSIGLQIVRIVDAVGVLIGVPAALPIFSP